MIWCSISTVTWNSGTLVHMHYIMGRLFNTDGMSYYSLCRLCVVETWLCIEVEMVWAVCDQYFIVILCSRAGKTWVWYSLNTLIILMCVVFLIKTLDIDYVEVPSRSQLVFSFLLKKICVYREHVYFIWYCSTCHAPAL